jgi:hypothetical protein
VSITKYFNTSGRPRAGVETVAALPDFAEHRDAIVAALGRLGHDADAASLPGVAMPLRDAHDELSRQFDGVMQAFAVMRSQPPLPLLDAAHVAGISAQLLAVLASPDGAMQERATIDDRITGDHALMRPAMAGMLDRLQTALAGGPAQAPGAAPLKALRLQGAGRAPDRTLIVLPDSHDAGPNVAGRLRQIFYADPLAVRGPRSYAGERPRQALRWLATVLMQQFPLGVEFQCYFHRGMRQIVVSSNVDQVNNDLRDFWPAAGWSPCWPGMGRMPRRRRRAPSATRRGCPSHGRFRQCERSRTRGHPGRHRGTAFPGARAPMAGPSDRGPACGRRVKEFVEMLDPNFDAQRLAGTRRPCGTCAEVVGLPDEGTRGPFWHSQNAQAGTDTKSIIARNVAAGIRTSITETRAGRLTFDTNTDSDSEN